MKIAKFLFLFFGFLLPLGLIFNSQEFFHFSASFKEWLPFHVIILSFLLKSILFLMSIYFLWFFYSNRSWTKSNKIFYLLYCLPLILLCNQSLREMAVISPIMGIPAFMYSVVFAYPLYKTVLSEKTLFRMGGLFLFLATLFSWLNRPITEIDLETYMADFETQLFYQVIISWTYWIASLFITAALAKSLLNTKASLK